MIYPFRFKIGDAVVVKDTCTWSKYRNIAGHVKALELSATKTTAVVQHEHGVLRVHESELRNIS